MTGRQGSNAASKPGEVGFQPTRRDEPTPRPLEATPEPGYSDDGHITGYGASIITFHPETVGEYAPAIVPSSAAEFTVEQLRHTIEANEKWLRGWETALVMRKVVADIPDAAYVDVAFHHDGRSGFASGVALDEDGRFLSVDIDLSGFSDATIRRYVAEERDRVNDRYSRNATVNFKTAEWAYNPDA